jgi:hypothetical protein
MILPVRERERKTRRKKRARVEKSSAWGFWTFVICCVLLQKEKQKIENAGADEKLCSVYCCIPEDQVQFSKEWVERKN